MKKFRIGLGQLNTKDNIENSFKKIEKQMEECTSKGAQLVIFPEMSTYLSETSTMEIAQTIDGEIISHFKELAVKHKIYIHNGSFVEKSKTNGKSYNTSMLINPKGEIETIYRKIHLFDIELNKELSYRESDRYERGDSIINHSFPLGDFGFSICYDLRFPELYRELTFRGSKLIFVPAAFTMFTGKDHWESLLRARAIENQVYIVAPNQIGEHPDNKLCYGNSMVIDPWGKVIARASDKVGVIVTDIDWDYLEDVRQKMPSLKNRVNLGD
ncbi:MAG: carbon-nitrogen hydrolase family protein [Spirochaetes bacterium]|nr:MAG: carbon-nitrogen hydrolase family protein [Spirochaetota bacterium]